MPQKADLPDDFLLEDASNLGLVLNDLQNRPGSRQVLLAKFKEFYEGAEEITTKIHGGTVQVFVHEKGLSQPIPATRLSDGTLRYLCLLVLLCHPTPPPLLCIEEPELGLHPDILATIAELLVQASQRTQVIVTTHSDALVSALTETPESVLVCDHDDAGTHLRRLGTDRLKKWLEKYSLGELWRMGEIGGTRW
jgi:predicted ATPase